MRVLNTLNDISIRSGGVVAALRGVFECTRFQSVVMCSECHPDDLPGVETVYTSRTGISPFKYVSGIRKDLDSIGKFDILHTHGVWLHINSATVLYAQKKKIPSVLSPHGMLYPEAFYSNHLRKSLFWDYKFKAILDKVSCVHVTCEREKSELRNLGVTAPIALIPNSVTVSQVRSSIEIKEAALNRKVGFLGRLDKRKRVDLLIDIWVEYKINGELVIAGEGDPAYQEFLKLKACGAKNITFLGFLSGTEKERFLRSLCALIVPSDFENFGMIIPEALSVGTPVIASSGTPWQILDGSDCGWWVRNNPRELKNAISAALDQTEGELLRRSENAFKLASEKFSSAHVNKLYEELYGWLCLGLKKPDFVEIK